VIAARPVLRDTARLSPDKLLNPDRMHAAFAGAADLPVLVVLAAGKGTRFGTEPKCIQSVGGKPLARHSIDAFQRRYGGPVVCLVHYRQDDVMAALGDDLVYVHSDDPTGGTAFAAYEAFSVPHLREREGLLFVTMGDRVVPESVFARMEARHAEEAGPGPRLTLLAARYEPPRHVGKGRIVRDARGRITRIVEQRDIDAAPDGERKATWQDVTEANCPLYVLPAHLLHAHLAGLTNDNAQGQYYLTDVVERIAAQGGDVRALTMAPADAEYDWLIADVTRPQDLALLEGLFQRRTEPAASGDELERAAAALRANRPPGQTAAIAAQLRELLDTAARDRQGFDPGRPVAIGIAGGRLRIAFMHPDMGRFFGPAWQMPIGAADAAGREQIVILAQEATDGAIHLFPTDHEFQERLSALPADDDSMYPGEEVSDWYAYEGFGTRMAERILLSLGYFTPGEVARRRYAGLPLPPPQLWVANGMRRPFSLIGNAIASVRTLREGTIGATVQRALGKEGFRGLRLATTGRIPRGGFSSSSAVTVAVKNAVNALYDLGISPDLLVHLACQAEYGTGVRAGSLDQATEQKGVAGQGALISSNPRDNFRVLGVYPVPTERFKVIFPYTVDRDREAWLWSYGMYGESANDPLPTTSEIRKLTGKAAEMAAILVGLPLDEDFFPHLEADLLQTGTLRPPTARWVADTLRQLPQRISREDLERRLRERRDWLVAEFRAKRHATAEEATRQADATLASLLEGWREPLLRKGSSLGGFELEAGVPLRAIVAYLFGEVVKNARLLHAPDTWIETVTRSQGGDRCFDIDPAALPDAATLMEEAPWERGLSGPERLSRWLTRAGARPVDVDRGLDDAALAHDPPPDLYLLEGGNFFGAGG
jgi:NDP-sugar pyrophosphorylase family protein